jgi:hypothetical protein
VLVALAILGAVAAALVIRTRGSVLPADVMLSLMEMQTRQNIVSMLSKSGSLVVVSAAELDMEGNELLADRLRKALEAASDTETDS